VAWRALVGVLPLQIDVAHGVSRLAWLGLGVSDALDLLAAEADAEAVLTAAWPLLQELPWQRCDLELLPARSPLLCRGEVVVQEMGLAVAAAPGQTLWQSLPPHLRDNLRNAHNRAERMGGMRIESAPIDVLFVLHERRWRSRQERGLFADRQVQAFHREVVAQLGDHVRCLQLVVAGEPAAAIYGFVVRQWWAAYAMGFDPRFAALSPAALLLADFIQRAEAAGARSVDVLRGDEPYKQRWGAQLRPLHRCTIVR
jgi:CelD/BcsL family acetyltransferase involved in cellulose biosynthesis